MEILKKRFEENRHRHQEVAWFEVERCLSQEKFAIIQRMEELGGEPDVFVYQDQLFYVDFSKESPAKRRNLTYDLEGFQERAKDKHQPDGAALLMAEEMGISMIDFSFYLAMQEVEDLDRKTSSWLFTPESIRKLGGAIFGDKRYGHVFYYHNSAKSYYSSRGFRGSLKL